MAGVQERLGDLSWLGITDRAWIEVDQKMIVNEQIDRDLKETEDKVDANNTSMTKGQRAAWIEYRQRLIEVPLQIGYPDNVFWPSRPE